MFNKRVLRIFVGGVTMLSAITTSEADCGYPLPLNLVMQLQSLTIDGVEQTDLTDYRTRQAVVSPSQYKGHGFDILYFGRFGETYDSP